MIGKVLLLLLFLSGLAYGQDNPRDSQDKKSESVVEGDKAPVREEEQTPGDEAVKPSQEPPSGEVPDEPQDARVEGSQETMGNDAQTSEDLLRQLNAGEESDAQESPLPQEGSGTVEEGSEAPEEGGPQEGELSAEEEEEPVIPQMAEIYRYSDRIVVKDSRTLKETTLFYNTKMKLLSENDEVMQGSSALSECRFEDNSKLRFFSRARYRLGPMNQNEHVILVDDFTRIKLKSRDTVTLLLPGGTRMTSRASEVYLETEGHFINIRNAGFYEVELSGHLIDPEDEIVPAGHRISIPMFGPELAEEKEPIVVREVSGMIIKTTGGYSFEEKPGFIIVSRPGLEDGVAYVAGARIKLDAGEKIRLRLP